MSCVRPGMHAEAPPHTLMEKYFDRRSHEYNGVRLSASRPPFYGLLSTRAPTPHKTTALMGGGICAIDPSWLIYLQTQTLTMSSVPPPCRVLLRSKDGVELYRIPERPTDPVNKPAERPFILKGATTLCQVDASNAYLHVAGKGIAKCSLDASVAPGASVEPFFAGTENVQMMDLSPQGKYLLTWERFYEDKRPDNLRVWETATGRLAASFTQKALKREAWPNLQWTADEAFAALHATNEVRFFPAAAFAQGYVDGC